MSNFESSGRRSDLVLERLLNESVMRGFDRNLNIDYVKVTPSLVEARVVVDRSLYQPAGIVHGGVFASIVESVGSAGGTAALIESSSGLVFVGTSNGTEFIKSVDGGVLEAIGEPIHQGVRTQLWKVRIVQVDTGDVVSVGVLRGQNVEPKRGKNNECED